MNSASHAFKAATGHSIAIVCVPSNYGLKNTKDDMASQFFYDEYFRDVSGFRNKAVGEAVYYHSKLQEHGITLAHIAPREGQIDQVYTADPAFTLLEPSTNTLHVLTSKFTNSTRQAEVDDFVKALKSLTSIGSPLNGIKLNIHEMQNNFEGTGDCYYDTHRDLIFAGYTLNPDENDLKGGRSHILAHQEVANTIGVEVISLEVVKPCFHIDTCLAPLPSGHILLYKDGLTDKSYDALIKNAFKNYNMDHGEYLIEIDENDALNNFATNMQVVGKQIFMPEFGHPIKPISKNLTNRLNEIGYDIEIIPYGQMIKGDGALHCTSHIIASRPMLG